MQPSKGFIDQTPDALRLTLVDGSLNRNQFTLMAGGTFELWGVQVEATVIGASHIVSFEAGPFSLHEVFACVNVPGGTRWTLPQLVRKPVEREFPGLRYEFAAWRIPWRQPEPPELVSLTRMAQSYAGGGRIGVVQDFPQGTLPAAPKTVIVGYIDDDLGVVIETAHSYPGRGLVLSRSSLRFTKEDRPS